MCALHVSRRWFGDMGFSDKDRISMENFKVLKVMEQKNVSGNFQMKEK